MNITITAIEPKDLGDIEVIIDAHGNYHCRLDPLFSMPHPGAYLARGIMSHRGCRVLARDNRGELLGFMTYRKKEWDTKHFGYVVAGIDDCVVVSGDSGLHAASLLFQSFGDWARRERVRFASCKASPQLEIRSAALASGFRYIETDLHLSREIFAGEKSPHVPEPYRLRDFEESDVPAVVRIITEADWSNRFHSDRRIDPGMATAVYVEWVRNGVQKANGHMTILAHGNDIAGFIFWTTEALPSREVILSGNEEVVAMNPAFRGKGLGAYLYGGCVADMARAGVKVAQTVVNDANIPAVKNLKATGFVPRYSVEIYHAFFS
jgi:GNAT superfamily N-acetyltransferase